MYKPRCWRDGDVDVDSCQCLNADATSSGDIYVSIGGRWFLVILQSNEFVVQSSVALRAVCWSRIFSAVLPRWSMALGYVSGVTSACEKCC